MLKERVRIFGLARELDLESKDLVALCRQNGIDIKSQLSTIEPEVRDQVVRLVQKKGISSASVPHRPIPTLPAGKIPVLETKPRPVPELGPMLSLRTRSHYIPQQNPGIERLLTTGEKADLGKLSVIPQLVEIDTESAMFKIRQTAERLCRKLLRAPRMRRLNDLIGEIEEKRLLNPRAVACLRHIQRMSNRAVHNTDDLFPEIFTPRDVDNAAETLARVLDAALPQMGYANSCSTSPMLGCLHS